jgi:hypothetical protein
MMSLNLQKVNQFVNVSNKRRKITALKYSIVTNPPTERPTNQQYKPQSTYIYRVQSCVWRLPKY